MSAEVLRCDDDVVLSRVVVGPLRTNTYLLGCARTGDTAVVDPGDDEPRITAALAGRRVVAAVLTHAHWDHVQAADALRARHGCLVLAHPAESAVWAHELAHLRAHGQWDWAQEQPPAGAPVPVPGWDGHLDAELVDGVPLELGRLSVDVLHTPGHTPGSVCLRAGADLLTGDTLFPGGPGLTGWPLSDFATVLASVEHRLLRLPGAVRVHPGHGPATTIGRERPSLEEWRRRGW
ncbi:glyoxylase-like metal-dependent hydrolase (beta-lactamase superfamily II) [Geodermatophilus tzadiensis]|uniref:Glyoxylase-like metal-dependent hydrolase (Beta-lactamase superfamily II) n=1 Tax=Geodermatophilus tzadiensis TaxID=1137988 RepID=A0A2T0U065_9ACTN|nr:MBL fold metallo-hydrolase [Geodermatophilus tzadiensis]PRY51299.1 glyoxylase-like metal-dependent hydrolase (beta-lactamase superfamily II) [Geodermatophilus tzadiensis]